MHHKITSISVRTYDTSFGGFPYVADVSIEIEAKVWTKLRNKGYLGMLYGVDVSNEVYRLTNQLVPAYNPSVDDKQLAVKGIKTISLKYYFKDHGAAEQLGLKVLKLKSGECVAPYGGYISIYPIQLKVVGGAR